MKPSAALSLLRDGLHHIAHLEARTGNGRAHGGNFVYIRKANDTHVRGHSTNHLSRRRIFDFLGDALHCQLVADFEARFRTNVQDDLTAVHRSHHALHADGAGHELRIIRDQFARHLHDCLIDRLTDNGLLEIAAAEVHTSAAETVPVTATAKQRCALAARLAFAAGHSQNLSRVDIDQPSVDLHDRLALLVAEAANSKASPT